MTEPLPNFLSGDPKMLVLMRITGRSLLLIFVCLELLGGALVGRGDWWAGIPVCVVSYLAVVATLGLMRRYKFGITWHQHIGVRTVSRP